MRVIWMFSRHEVRVTVVSNVGAVVAISPLKYSAEYRVLSAEEKRECSSHYSYAFTISFCVR